MRKLKVDLESGTLSESDKTLPHEDLAQRKLSKDLLVREIRSNRRKGGNEDAGQSFHKHDSCQNYFNIGSQMA